MRLLGDKKKKQYEANLRQGAMESGLNQQDQKQKKKKKAENGFKPIDPAPVSPPGWSPASLSSAERCAGRILGFSAQSAQS